MSDPKRYSDLDVWKALHFGENDSGWVKYEDYARLKAEVERVGAENSHLHKGIYSLSLNVGQLKDEVERLTKAGDEMHEQATNTFQPHSLRLAMEAWEAAKKGDQP